MTLVAFPERWSARLERRVQQDRWEEIRAMVESGLPAHAPAGPGVTLMEAWVRRAMVDVPLPSHVEVGMFELLLDSWPGSAPGQLSLLSLVARALRPDWVGHLLAAGHDPNLASAGHTPLTAMATRWLDPGVPLCELAPRPERGWAQPAPPRLACLDLLVRAGAQVDLPAWENATPLVLAALSKDTGLACALLAHGARPLAAPAARGVYGATPLEVAIASHNETLVAALLRAGACPVQPAHAIPGFSGTLLELAAAKGQAGMLQALAADAHHPSSPAHGAWWVALSAGNFEVVEWFLQKGVDLEAPSPQGLLPIQVAASHGHLSLMAILSRHGPGPARTGPSGQTAWGLLARHDPKIHDVARRSWVGDEGNVLVGRFPPPGR